MFYEDIQNYTEYPSHPAHSKNMLINENNFFNPVFTVKKNSKLRGLTITLNLLPPESDWHERARARGRLAGQVGVMCCRYPRIYGAVRDHSAPRHRAPVQQCTAWHSLAPPRRGPRRSKVCACIGRHAPPRATSRLLAPRLEVRHRQHAAHRDSPRLAATGSVKQDNGGNKSVSLFPLFISSPGLGKKRK